MKSKGPAVLIALHLAICSANAGADPEATVTLDPKVSATTSGIKANLISMNEVTAAVDLPLGLQFYSSWNANLGVKWGWPPVTGNVGLEVGLTSPASGDKIAGGVDLFGGPYGKFAADRFEAKVSPWSKLGFGLLGDETLHTTGYQVGPVKFTNHRENPARKKPAAPADQPFLSKEDWARALENLEQRGQGQEPVVPAPGPPLAEAPVPGPEVVIATPDAGPAPSEPAAPPIPEEHASEAGIPRPSPGEPATETSPEHERSPMRDLLEELERLEETTTSEQPPRETLRDPAPERPDLRPDREEIVHEAPEILPPSNEDRQPLAKPETESFEPMTITIGKSGVMYKSTGSGYHNGLNLPVLTRVMKGTKAQLLDATEPGAHLLRYGQVKLLNGPDAGLVGWIPFSRLEMPGGN